VVLGNTPVSFLVLNKPNVFLRQREGELFRSCLELLITQAGNPHYLIECQQPPESSLEDLYVHGLHKHLQVPLLPREDQTLLLSSLQPLWWGETSAGCWLVCNHKQDEEMTRVFSRGNKAGSSKREVLRKEDSHGDA